MKAIWTLDGDETSWSTWAENIALAPATPLILSLISRNKAVKEGWALDIGCGTGRAFLPLVEAGYKVIGIDPIMKSLQYCQERMGQENLIANPILASAASIPLRNQSVDFVIAIGSLFHLGILELMNTLGEIKRVLHPDGKAVLHFLALGDWRRALAKEISPERVPIPSFRSVVTCFCEEGDIQEWINQTGMRLTQLELKTNETASGMQKNWIAHCEK